MTVGPKDEGRVHNDLASLLSGGKSVQIVSLRSPTGERRFPVDLLREDVQPLPSTAWVAFQGDNLGDPPAYAADLMRRLLRVKCQWVAQASLHFVEKPQLIELARQSNCRGLLFDGELICSQYFTPESVTPPEAAVQLAQSMRCLADNGIFTIVRFV